MKRAIYPGSFDPLTNGHLDIIQRSLEVFDHVLVSVAYNPDKTGLFSPDERVDLIQRVAVAEGIGDKVTVEAFHGLLVDHARQKHISAIVRGLRAVSDFDYEFQMATMNRRLCPSIESFLMMTGEAYFYLSSRLVKEVAMFGGDITGLVHPLVQEALGRKLPQP